MRIIRTSRLGSAAPTVAMALVPVFLATACIVESGSNKKSATTSDTATRRSVTAAPTATPYEVTAGFAEEDTVASDTVTDTTAALRTITPQATLAALKPLPLEPPAAGPATLRIQILLDRANFSPGVITGAWSDNARRALQWFRMANGMDSSAVVDAATLDRLTRAAGNAPLVTQYTVTDSDVAGPFVTIPSNVYKQADLPCLCYQSAAEELEERFHSSRTLLHRLNPKANLSHITAGTTLWVPNVARDTSAPAPYVTAKIVVSRTGFWTHALDSAGHVVAHYPSTLGSSYNPSPTGQYAIDSVYPHPIYHYDPKVLNDPKIPQDRPPAKLPPGPNSPVGVVWMALTKEHLGIHGTENPATIGLTESHGCVRLTNWDAWTLSKSVHSGTPVTFP
jgi:lipoprotein-anchoring transpeptidase ErfK/SrfK